MVEIDNKFKLKNFEVFFSKELLENQGRRDVLHENPDL